MMKKAWMVGSCLVFAACASNNSSSAVVSLTAVTTATAAACPNGGVTIASGLDTNGNGVLDASEVTDSQNVCNGASPTATPASLVSTTMLSVGNSHCPDGGTEIDTGLDNGAGGGIAGDGVLQAGEITATQYVCSGGGSAPSSLVSTTTLAVGNANCANGGTEIDTGLDNGAGGGTAGDGILQPGEITATQYVCNGGSSAKGSLVSTTTLPTGNSNCANGGTEIDTGLDNGAGGGIAGDGILQPGEITATQYVCNGGSAAPGSLVSTTTLPIGNSNCANGGTEIDTGLDNGAGGGIAGDGILQPGEITATQYVCAGAGGPSELVATTPLLPGDSHCANGGIEIKTGLDNGANGGTAGDGVLQPGEVTSAQFVCNGSAGSGSQFNVGTMTEPAGPAGVYTIDTSGGDGTGSDGEGSGSGGNAGKVLLEMGVLTLGGHVKIFSTGVVDASFSLPTIAFTQGPVPFVVPRSTVLHSYADQNTGLDSGDAFFEVDSDTNLYTSRSGAAVAVTGLDIPSDVTLTLANNFNGGSQAYLQFAFDVRNAGTLTTTSLDGLSAGSIELYMGNYLGLDGSTVALNGADVSDNSTAGTGGNFNVNYAGTFLNQGTINAYGGSASEGAAANAGSVSIVPQETTGDGDGLYNTGAIDTHGGNGFSAAGYGGGIQLYTNYGELDNSAALFAKGGSCTAGGCVGQYGGYIQMHVVNVGNFSNSGALTGAGGDGPGGGGGADEIDLETSGGGYFLNSGALDASGGDGFTASGGSGNEIYINGCCGGEADQATQVDVPYGSVSISGSMVTRGGVGAAGGGAGGEFSVYWDPYAGGTGQEITLLGYTDLIMNGGNAGRGGIAGAGGALILEQDNSEQQVNWALDPGGAMINYAKVSARGGNGLNENYGYGGAGGSVLLQTQQATNFSDNFEIVANYGDIDVRGGDGAGSGSSSAGPGGSVTFLGIQGVQNSGAIDASGGNTVSQSATGATGSSITLQSEVGPVLNSGTLTTNGGAGLQPNSSGNAAGEIAMFGTSVTNSAALTCNGGDGAVNGGAGGDIELFSSVGQPTSNTGTLSNFAGTGANAGEAGSCTVDGASLFLARPVPSSGVIFVTADTFNADLGGLSGANAKCNSDSGKPANGGTYKALLPGNNATTSGLTYVRADGTAIAVATGGNLAATIQNAVTTTANTVWTGSDGRSCSTWTDGTSDSIGTVGQSITPNQWFDVGTIACNGQASLYCVQQ